MVKTEDFDILIDPLLYEKSTNLKKKIDPVDDSKLLTGHTYRLRLPLSYLLQSKRTPHSL